MIISIHQPAYLPWLGYFDKIMQSELFVYLDTVQFEKNSFINRNKVRTSQEFTWLTVPVKAKGHTASSLNELQIDLSQQWESKHLKTIFANYKKALRFEECYSKLESLYQTRYELLSELCYSHLLFWLSELNIKTKIVRASEYNFESSNSQLVLDICRHFNADTYLSGALGVNYLNEASFEEYSIEVVYQNYKHPVYPQLWGDFIPYMSILDLWMNSIDFTVIPGGTK